MSAVSILINVLLLLLALPATVSCLYLLQQTLLSWPLPPPQRSSRRHRFDMIVPAHNEAANIAQTIANLQTVDWPRELYRVIVVADNCTDNTAAIAAAAGAQVLVRTDTSKRGKGFALLFAFDHSLRDGWAEALAVVDADAVVSPNLLEAFASRLEQGAHAVQVHYGIHYSTNAWRTRLLSIAMAAYHVTRSRARERQGVSSGIHGNGWCVTPELIRQVPYNSFSLTEDIEYGIALGMAGYRVVYAGEAVASQDMTTTPQAARTQRQRWELGRFQLIRACTWSVLKAAIARRSAVCLDLALNLLVLPLSYVVLEVVAFSVAAILGWLWHPALAGWLYVALGCIASLFLYVLRGWSFSGTGVRGLLDLLGAPIFIVWKLMLMLGRRHHGEWVRTERKPS